MNGRNRRCRSRAGHVHAGDAGRGARPRDRDRHHRRLRPEPRLGTPNPRDPDLHGRRHHRVRKRPMSRRSWRSPRTASRGRPTSLVPGSGPSAATGVASSYTWASRSRGAATMRFRAEPQGDARLAADIVRAGNEGENALRLAGPARRRRRGHVPRPFPGRRSRDTCCSGTFRPLRDARSVRAASGSAELIGPSPSSVGRASPRLRGRQARGGRRPRARDERPFRCRAEQRDASVAGVRRHAARRESVGPARSRATVHRAAGLAGVVRPEQGVLRAGGVVGGSGSRASREGCENRPSRRSSRWRNGRARGTLGPGSSYSAASPAIPMRRRPTTSGNVATATPSSTPREADREPRDPASEQPLLVRAAIPLATTCGHSIDRFS